MAVGRDRAQRIQHRRSVVRQGVEQPVGERPNTGLGGEQDNGPQRDQSHDDDERQIRVAALLRGREGADKQHVEQTKSDHMKNQREHDQWDAPRLVAAPRRGGVHDHLTRGGPRWRARPSAERHRRRTRPGMSCIPLIGPDFSGASAAAPAPPDEPNFQLRRQRILGISAPPVGSPPWSRSCSPSLC